MFQKFHEKLLQKSFPYSKWHKNPQSNIIHFVIFAIIGVVVAAYLSVIIGSAGYNHFAYNVVSAVESVKRFVWYSYEQLLEKGEIKPAGKIIEISLSYNGETQPILSISGIRILNGYVPRNETPKDAYILEVLDTNNKVIENLPFKIPNEIEDPHTILNKVDFILTLDWKENAKKLQIVTSKGAILTSKSLDDTDVKTIENTPDFKSLQILNLKNSSTAALAPVPKATGKLEIVLIGDEYQDTDLALFNSDADRFIATFLSVQPFKSREDQIHFNKIWNTRQLNCGSYIQTHDTKCLFLATTIVNSTGVLYDKIGVIVNGQNAGNVLGVAIRNQPCCAVQYNSKPLVFVHEMGHLLGGLLDEYNVHTSDGPIDNKTHDDIDGNCYAGNPEDSDWKNLVSCWDYSQGCTHPNWYSPYSLSMMYAYLSQVKFFDAPSQVALKKKIDSFAGAFFNNNLDVRITSPQDGDTVSGIVSIFANSNYYDKIVRVNFYIDNTLFGTKYELTPYQTGSSAYIMQWDTTQQLTCGSNAVSNSPGQHTITVTAYDAAENAVSKTITVNLLPTVNLYIKKCTYGCVNLPSNQIPQPGDGSFDFYVFEIIEDLSNKYISYPTIKTVGGQGLSRAILVNANNFTIHEFISPMWNLNKAFCQDSSGTSLGTPTSYGIKDLTTIGRKENEDITCYFLNETLNPTPVIDSISPTSSLVGDPGGILTVTGKGFLKNSVVKWNGSDRTTTLLTPTPTSSPMPGSTSVQMLTAIIPVSDLATAGRNGITVFNPSPGGGTSNEANFYVSNPLPKLNSISPVIKNVGDPSFTLTLYGENFVKDSFAQFEYSKRATTYVSPTELKVTILASDLTTKGFFSITVYTIEYGGGLSEKVVFNVSEPLVIPTITSLTPSSATKGGLGLNVTVNGTNFVSGATVQFDKSDRPTKYVSSTQLIVSVPATDLLNLRTFDVTAFNPNVGAGIFPSNSLPFYVVGNAACQLFTTYGCLGSLCGSDSCFQTGNCSRYYLCLRNTCLGIQKPKYCSS